MKDEKNSKDNFAKIQPHGIDDEGKAEDAAGADPDSGADTAAVGLNLKYASARDIAKGGLLGAFIGLAVIIPGVSGSAVAIILKLYEKLLYALGNIFKEFKNCVLFLLPIVLGAAAGLLVGFFGVKMLIDAMMFAVVALFAGLMLGAFPAVCDEVRGERHTPLRIILFIAGLLLPAALSLIAVFLGDGETEIASPQAYEYVIYLLLGFAVAITQLVPGLSATALLMTTGHYVPLIQSVSLDYWQTNPEVFAVYACLIAGFVAGLLCCAKLLGLILKRHRAATFHAVAGLALGSVFTMFFNPEIMTEYSAWAGGERFGPELALGSLLFIVGIVVAYLFVKLQRRKNLPLKN